MSLYRYGVVELPTSRSGENSKNGPTRFGLVAGVPIGSLGLLLNPLTPSGPPRNRTRHWLPSRTVALLAAWARAPQLTSETFVPAWVTASRGQTDFRYWMSAAWAGTA